MPAVFRAAPAETQKVLSGQAFFQPEGVDANGKPFPLRTLGNVEVVRNVKTEHLDITTNELPEKPILRRITTTLNEELKITCMSFIPLVQALAHMAPVGEFWTQAAVPAGEIDVAADAKDYDILECKDEDGNRVYGVTFTGTLDRTKYNYDARSGRVEVIGDRTSADTITFTAPAVTSAARKAVYRMLQSREIRGRFEVRENNLLGEPSDHVYPLISIRMNGSQNLIDGGKEPTKVEIEGLVEIDTTQPVGRERGYVVEI